VGRLNNTNVSLVIWILCTLTIYKVYVRYIEDNNWWWSFTSSWGYWKIQTFFGHIIITERLPVQYRYSSFFFRQNSLFLVITIHIRV
jgi:hypothetical protein